MRLKVDPSDGGGWNGIGCSRERGLGAVIEDIETTDTEVKIVMSEKFGKIQRLVFHCTLSALLNSLLQYNYECSPAIQIDIYSSSSGGGSGGNGEETLVEEVVTLCGWASISGFLSGMLVEGVVALSR